eukprot:sb/3471183/
MSLLSGSNSNNLLQQDSAASNKPRFRADKECRYSDFGSCSFLSRASLLYSKDLYQFFSLAKMSDKFFWHVDSRHSTSSLKDCGSSYTSPDCIEPLKKAIERPTVSRDEMDRVIMRAYNDNFLAYATGPFIKGLEGIPRWGGIHNQSYLQFQIRNRRYEPNSAKSSDPQKSVTSLVENNPSLNGYSSAP